MAQLHFQKWFWAIYSIANEKLGHLKLSDQCRNSRDLFVFDPCSIRMLSKKATTNAPHRHRVNHLRWLFKKKISNSSRLEPPWNREVDFASSSLGFGWSQRVSVADCEKLELWVGSWFCLKRSCGRDGHQKCFVVPTKMLRKNSGMGHFVRSFVRSFVSQNWGTGLFRSRGIPTVWTVFWKLRTWRQFSQLFFATEIFS